MSSSKRFEDLKDELISTEEKIKLQLKHNINEVMLNKLCSEGDGILQMMKREVDSTPQLVRSEMQDNWVQVSEQWNSFKTNARNSRPISWNEFSPNETLNRGISILERTNQSVMRAEMVSRESEAIGQEVISELGEQRESLVRTRDRLDGTNEDLRRTRVILRSINRRLLTNKCMLIFIIILEILILLGVVYFRFIRKHK